MIIERNMYEVLIFVFRKDLIPLGSFDHFRFTDIFLMKRLF